MTSYEELKEQLNLAKSRAESQLDSLDTDLPPMDWMRRREKIMAPVAEISRKVRKIQPLDSVKMSDIPEYGDRMTLEDFVANVESGGFIDYDGFGNYATATEEADLFIHPSDVQNGEYRTDFTHVVWYNK